MTQAKTHGKDQPIDKFVDVLLSGNDLHTYCDRDLNL